MPRPRGHKEGASALRKMSDAKSLQCDASANAWPIEARPHATVQGGLQATTGKASQGCLAANFEPRPRAYFVCIYGRCISIPGHVYIPRCGRSLNPSQPGAIAEVENARPKTPAQNLLRRPPDATGKVRCESFSTVNLFRFSG